MCLSLLCSFIDHSSLCCTYVSRCIIGMRLFLLTIGRSSPKCVIDLCFLNVSRKDLLLFQSDFRSFSSSVSRRTVYLPDGTVEQHETKRANDGTEETTKTTTLADGTSHSVKTTRRSDGSEEVTETEGSFRQNRQSLLDGSKEQTWSESQPALEFDRREKLVLQSLFQRFFGQQ